MTTARYKSRKRTVSTVQILLAPAASRLKHVILDGVQATHPASAIVAPRAWSFVPPKLSRKYQDREEYNFVSIRIQICRALSGAALLAIASASGALAKDSGSFTVGCLTQDTALQTSEGGCSD